ncbi:serine/threonine protein kinase [Actinoplanes lutulentus]|uniref:Serine/threonine protein kinase n=1 Tax=Actinoplanes lutulentus TaxID=1287878 RepID=A0A327ZBN8_9ACTN|nr:protein kinase [Actinoplanes lutulentus]MBB2946864.1 serine/threonine protein kinase [Actinoplanes lutulentus]RAK35758.1 serine/threonine protein kinase [Actinoplanes lutulentus]
MSGKTTREENTPGTPPTTRENAAPATTRENAPPATTRENAAPVRDSGGLPDAVFTRYQPERALAIGGEAHLVMLVRDRHTGEQRVAKVYPTTVRPATSLLDALRTAERRHVVRVIDWGESVAYGLEMSWEVQEYAPGGSLAAYATGHGGALPPDQVRVVLQQVTESLAYLHGELRHGHQVGMAHRDIKPENILLRDQDPLDLVLCDFGLVAELRATRRTTGRAGTPAYQAPETWWQKSQEPEQDWWSLGVVIVELLTGRNPNSGVGGHAANERAIFEHIAKYGVDLDGVTDPDWRLLCHGLLTRSPEERWGVTEVRAWLAGERPAVRDAPIAEPEPPAAPPVAPFEVAGRLCRSPEHVGAAFSENWPAGLAHFQDRTKRLDLSDWMKENFPNINLPGNLFRTDVSGRADAAARLTRFIAWVAPEMPPAYEQRAADANGIAMIAQSAASGDPTAAGLLGAFDVGLLRALARHRCRLHTRCAGGQPGCAVLTEAADRLDQIDAAVRERIDGLAVSLAAGGTPVGWASPPRMTEVDQALPVAYALAVRLLADPDHRDHMLGVLRKQKVAGRRVWWRALREDAAGGTDVRQLAAGAVASALIPVATAEAAAEQARDAQVKQERRNERAAQVGTVPARGRGVVRNAWRDTGNMLWAVLLAYLTTFAAAAANRFEEFSLDQTRTPEYLAYVTSVQTMVALPILVVLGCLLIRPAEPGRALRRARLFCWLFAIAVGIIVQAEQAEIRALVRFPIILRSGVRDTLFGLNSNYAGIFPYAVIGAVVVAIWAGRRLVNRAAGTESGPSGRTSRDIRAVLIGAVVVLYLIAPLYVWQQWSPPFLPSPVREWWVW